MSQYSARALRPLTRWHRRSRRGGMNGEPLRRRWLSLFPLLSLLLSSCGRQPVSDRDLQTIAHIVVVVQENRSTDNLLNGFPGIDTVRVGYNHRGQRVPLLASDFDTPYDIDHSLRDFTRDYDHGKMDGYDLARVGDVPGAHTTRNFGPYP